MFLATCGVVTVNIRIPSDLTEPESITRTFFTLVRTEVTDGNSYLSKEEQVRLQTHYPFMMDSNRYPPELLSTIYVCRRLHPVQTLLSSAEQLVLDAGCGYGADSLLFAATGAKVMAVDLSADNIEIAQKRKRYYEQALDRPLDVTFLTADLNDYTPDSNEISVTWLSSVLAIVKNQDTFLARIYKATRAGGRIMIVDYNLWNPHFLWTEWRRRRRAFERSPEFSRNANYWAMVTRKRRDGAFFYPQSGGGVFDDVQFFTPGTLGRLLEQVGFRPLPSYFSGFAVPFLFKGLSMQAEKVFSQAPIIKRLGRAYVVTGVK
jgi:SAM-dependent methyltransferase